MYSNILKWWSSNEAYFPRMAALARTYLAIPASSAFSERCFSSAANTRNIKRTSISDAKLEMLLVLKTIDPELWSLFSDSTLEVIDDESDNGE